MHASSRSRRCLLMRQYWWGGLIILIAILVWFLVARVHSRNQKVFSMPNDAVRSDSVRHSWRSVERNRQSYFMESGDRGLEAPSTARCLVAWGVRTES